MSSPVRSTRKRGRPAQLSRAQIVAAALELLRLEPDRRLTMQALARVLEVSPMALYSHVRNRADLTAAMATEILAQVRFEVSAQDWRETVRAWARALRRQFLRYPFMAGLLREGVATPAAWLELSNPLLQALREAGLKGQALADAQRWVSRVVTGSVLMELILPAAVPEEFNEVNQALQGLPPGSRGVWLEILPQLGQHSDDEVFEYTLERTLDALGLLLRQQPHASR